MNGLIHPYLKRLYALIDTGAESELSLPETLVESMKLVPTGKVGTSRGSGNHSSKKSFYKPMKLTAIFFRDMVPEERSDYVSVGVFEELTSQLETASDNSSKRARRESGGSTSSKEGVIDSVPVYAVVEHRPPNKPGQRVILGAAALRKLCFHVNVAERCLEIEEEHVEEDD